MFKKGFTLLEVLVVICIIGIISAVVFAILTVDTTNKAQDVNSKARTHDVQSALEQYFIDKGAYPAQSDGLAVLTTLDPKYLKNADSYSGLTYDVNSNGGYELSFVLKNQGESVGNNVKLVSGRKVYFVDSTQQ